MNIGLFTILKNLKIIGKQSDVVSDRRVKAFDRVYFFKQGQQRKMQLLQGCLKKMNQ
jgi:hypothetical protein